MIVPFTKGYELMVLGFYLHHKVEDISLGEFVLGGGMVNHVGELLAGDHVIDTQQVGFCVLERSSS
jgi:hypothetical protein